MSEIYLSPCGNLFSIHCFTSQQLRIYSWQIYDAEIVRCSETIQLLVFFTLQSNQKRDVVEGDGEGEADGYHRDGDGDLRKLSDNPSFFRPSHAESVGWLVG